MAEDRNPIRVAADLGGAIGFVGLVVTAIMWLLSLPLLPVVIVGSISFGALVVGVLIHVFFSNNVSFETIGEWRQGYSVARVPALSQQPSEQDNEARLVSLKELEEQYEPLKKLEPHFVDIGNEYVPAYNDENGVIVRGSSSAGDSFHVLARSFGNQHPRQRVKSLKQVSFMLNFICFDRATRSKCKSVNIHRGAWLSEAETEIDFPAHCPPRRAIIVTTEGSENHVYAVRRDSDSSYKGIQPLREELTGSVYTVFATLLLESRNSKSYQYILEIIREPGFGLFLNDAVHWKSGHLDKFVDEGFAFCKRLHEIWKDAHDQVPFPPVDPNRPIFYNYALSGSDRPEPFDYTAANTRIRAIEQEQEEKLIEEIKNWEARAADWVDLFIGAEQRKKFLECVPSIEDGFNRGQKPFGYRIQLFRREGEPSPPPKLPYWTLNDTVSSRRDKLIEIIKQLR